MQSARCLTSTPKPHLQSLPMGGRCFFAGLFFRRIVPGDASFFLLLVVASVALRSPRPRRRRTRRPASSSADSVARRRRADGRTRKADRSRSQKTSAGAVDATTSAKKNPPPVRCPLVDPRWREAHAHRRVRRCSLVFRHRIRSGRTDGTRSREEEDGFSLLVGEDHHPAIAFRRKEPSRVRPPGGSHEPRSRPKQTPVAFFEIRLFRTAAR